MKLTKHLFMSLSFTLGLTGLIYSGLLAEPVHAIYDPSKTVTVPEGEMQTMSITTTDTKAMPIEENQNSTDDSMTATEETDETLSITEQPYNPEIAETKSAVVLPPNASLPEIDRNAIQDSKKLDSEKLTWGAVSLLLVVCVLLLFIQRKRKQK